MVLSNSSILRSLTALFSIVLVLFAAVTLYTTTSAVILLHRYLEVGNYVWPGFLVRSGGDRPDTHNVNLTYEFSSEICVWVAAGSSILAGFLSVAKIGFDERLRRRRNVDAMNNIIPASKFSKVLSYIATSFTLAAFVSSFVSAIYTWEHRLAVQQSTCYWEMGQQHDAPFKCTLELAVCEISPYLLKHDISEHPKVRRQEACGHLQFSRGMLFPLLLLSFFLVVGYAVQIYQARRQERSSVSVEEKIASARSSSDSNARSEVPPRNSWGSNGGCRIEKIE